MSYLQLLSSYINITLRNKLGYRETYSFPSLNEDKNIIFFTKDLSSNFDLKGMLLSNKDLVISLKQTFKDFLLREIESRNIKEIKLLIGDKPGERGIGIILIQEQVEMIDINPYVEIISHFDTAEQIDEYCRSNKNTVSICKKKELWIGLIKKVYPFTYKGEYNYEKLYKEWLMYRTYKIDRESGLPLGINPEYSDSYVTSGLSHIVGTHVEVKLSNISEIVKFLLLEGIINPKYYKYYFANLMDSILNQEYLQIIINKMRDTLNDEEYADLLEYVFDEPSPDVDSIRTFMRLDFGPQYDMQRKMEYFLNYIRDTGAELEDEMIDVISGELPFKLRKEFKQNIEDLYS